MKENPMNIRVLLVDDETDFIEILAERLSARGLSVATASSGEEALKYLEEHETDVVILDVLMPGRDGLSILHDIKRTWHLTEVIMLTGHGTIESAVEGMRAGAFDYVMKPSEINDLVKKIQAAHGHKVEQKTRIHDAIARAGREKELMNETSRDDKLVSIGELASGIAHEINNPVAVMVEQAGWIDDLLSEDSLDFEEIKRALRQISLQGERCKEITHKLLSFARKTDPVLKEVQVNGLIAELVKNFENRSRFDKIEVLTDLAADVPLILASPFELQQVFVNLINNSIDAMLPEGGTLLITSAVEADFVVASFSDSGPGIPEEIMGKIFEPFFTTRPVGKGSGLGLSICYGIVKKLGGKISVSTAAGVGTTVKVYLPRQPGEEPAPGSHAG